MTFTPNALYLVTKSSDNNSFRMGELITLRADGCLWAGTEFVEPAEIESATQGMEIELMMHMPPKADGEWRNLLQIIRNYLDSRCFECDSARAFHIIDEVLDGRDA